MNHGTREPRGCNLGRRNCPNFHPKLCPQSIRKSECFNTECKLQHVRGTRRAPDSGVDIGGGNRRKQRQRNPISEGQENRQTVTHAEKAKNASEGCLGDIEGAFLELIQDMKALKVKMAEVMQQLTNATNLTAL